MGACVSGAEHEGVWEAYARSYDRILPLLPFYQEVVSRHVAALTRPDIRRVIDVGAGTGNVAIAVAARGIQVTAVDNCPEMLRQLRRKLGEEGSTRLSVVERDAASLAPWADGHFDSGTALLALFAMSQARSALRELMRVVRPGGLLVLTETRRQFRLDPLLEAARTFLSTQGLLDGLRQDWERVEAANRCLDLEKRGDRLCAEEIELTLQHAGFRIVEVKASHLGQCETIWAEKGVAGA